MKNYTTSLIFNDEPVEKLNNKIAKKIDSRLYLVAYYKPKRISSNTSSEHAFWTAVTNIYTLFTDCAGYVNDNLLTLLFNKKLLVKSDKWKINNFIQLIRSSRSLFCHNMVSEFTETDKQLRLFNKFLKEQLRRESPNVSIPYKPFLSSEDWEVLISYLHYESQNCFDILDNSINKISACNEEKKKYIVDKWLEYILKWYGRSSYFQIIGKSYFNFKNLKNRNNGNDYWTNKQCNIWIQDQKEKWKEKFTEYVMEVDKPIFPHEILSIFFHEQVVNGNED